MQIHTASRKSLFDWKDLFENYKRQEEALPTSTLTALNEFSRPPRLLRLGGTSSEVAIQQSDAEIHHVSPPNYPLDDLGEVPSSNVLEEESEDGTIETLRAMRPQFLQQYHPTFRALARPVEEAKEQEDLLKLYWDRPYSYDYIQVQCKEVSFRVGEIEPLYCSLSLYWVDYKVERQHSVTVNLANSGRISESFNFEVASVAIQERFREVGAMLDESNLLDSKNALFSISPEQRSPGLFLVLQVSKVLQGDPDKVLEPYAKGKGSTQQLSTKALEASERLGLYRQPVAFGFCQVFTEKGLVADGVESREGMGVPTLALYKCKTALSDSQLLHSIAELLQEPQAAKERAMDGRCLLLLTDVGKLPDIAKLTPRPFLLDTGMTSRARWDDEASGPTGVPTGTSASRVVREVRPLPLCNFSAEHTSGPASAAVAVNGRPRPVPIHTALSNVLYVYPLTLERSQHRNLAVKVELRCLRERGPTQAMGMSAAGGDVDSMAYLTNGVALPCIFNRQRGAVFTTYAYTQVSYHQRNPQLNDEIKIRLPDVITPAHHLVFSVYHVHVKKQSDFRRVFTSSLKQAVGGGPTSSEGERKNSATLIGIGSLPLLSGVDPMTPGCLLPDSVYSLVIRPAFQLSVTVTADGVIMDEDNDDDPPTNAGPQAGQTGGVDAPPMVLRLGTVAQSSIHAQDENLAHFLNLQPHPYAAFHGSSPELIPTFPPRPPSPDKHASRRLSASLNRTVQQQPVWAAEPDPLRLVDAMKRLLDASDTSVAAHFLVVMRQILRTLSGGMGEPSAAWADPLSLPLLRVSSFVTLLHVFHKAKNGAQSTVVDDKELDVLRAYAELMFDEDHAGTVKTPRKSSTMQTTLKEDERATMSSTLDISRSVGMSSSSGLISTVGATSPDTSPGRRPMGADRRRGSATTRTLNSAAQAEVESSINSGFVARARAKWEKWNRDDASPATAIAQCAPTGHNGQSPPMANRRKPTMTTTATTSQALTTTLTEKAVQVTKLTGSGDRWEASRAASTNNTGSGATPAVPERWWPWTYEVLIAQWRALLRVLQEVDVDFSRRSSPASASATQGDASGSTNEYPFSKEELPTGTRNAAQLHGPALLSMIRKSLALRIHHEGLDTPVLLDDDTLWCLDDLVCALAHEISERYTCGLWIAIELNKGLARFLRDLFALIHPSQAAQLVRSYFRSLRHCIKTEQMELKFEFLDILLQYDYVHINRPWLFNHPKEEAVDENGVRVGDIDGPEAHWLARLTIEECMQCVSHSEASVRVRGISLLRHIMVQHCFDPSYQIQPLREGVAAMYLPLIGQLVQRADLLEKQAPGSADRKELLACLLYVLQNSPDRLLRGLWRHIQSEQETLDDETANTMVQQSAQALCANGQGHGLDSLLRVLHLVDLVIDTFEYPFGNPGTRGDESSVPLHVLVPGIRPVGGSSSPRGTTGGTLDRRAEAVNNGPTGADALSALNHYMLQENKGRRGQVDRKLRQDNAGVRAWKHQLAKHGDSMIKTSTVARVGEASAMTLLKACKWVCHQAAQVVLDSTMSIAQEVIALDRAQVMKTQRGRRPSGANAARSFSTPGSAASEFIPPGPLLRGVTPALYRVLLHVLTKGQSDLTLITCLDDTRRLIQDIGIESFLEPSNSRYDWLKQTLIYCNHPRPALRNAARSFIVSLSHFTFLKTGSVTRIRLPLSHVFCDALSWIWGTVDKSKDKGPGASTESAEVVRQKALLLLAPLKKCLTEALDSMDAVLPQNVHSAFASRMYKIFSSQLLLLEAYVCNLQLESLSKRLQSTRLKTKDLIAQGELSGLSDEPVIQELLLRTADLFSPLESPEARIFWLQRLAQFHSMRGNTAELAATHVKIFESLQSMMSEYESGSTAVPAPAANGLSTSLSNSLSGSGSANSRTSVRHKRKSSASLRLRLGEEAITMSSIHPDSLAPAYQAWRSREEVKSQMLEAAAVAATLYAQVQFPLLALRSFEHLSALYRADMDLQGMAQACEDMSRVLSQAVAERSSPEYLGREFSLGGFFRVSIFGPGFPESKEYVYRVKARKHLSEFQDRLLSTLQKPGGIRLRKECIKVVPDSAEEKVLAETDEDKETVYLKITSLKPVLQDEEGNDLVSAVELGVSRFFFQVPFTSKGGAHGSTAEQFKRTTELEVENPFPCCTSRQVVKRRTVTVQSPIECALDDVRQRCRVIRELVLKPNERINKNAMMQLLQGSVVPQVHGGAIEVAQSFLSGNTGATYSAPGIVMPPHKLATCRQALRQQLVDFLDLCFKLILKSREILGIVRKRSSPTGGVSVGTGLVQADPNRAVDQSTIMWQKEVESGFNTMVVKLYPMINQVEEAAELLKRARELDVPKY